MIQDSSFFKYVWRFNALVIAAGSMIILGGLLLLGVRIINEGNNRKFPLINKENQLSIGLPNSIQGTDYIYMRIFDSKDYSLGEKVLNYLFIDTKDNKHKLLIENFDNHFKEVLIIYDKFIKDFDNSVYDSSSSNSKDGKAILMIYKISQNDDKEKISFSNIDGTFYQPLIEDIEKIYSIQQVSDEKVLFLYAKNNQIISDIYSVPSMTKLSTSFLPTMAFLKNGYAS